MDDVESCELYENHASYLVRIAVSRLGMQRRAACELAFEVCLSALHRSRARAVNANALHLIDEHGDQWDMAEKDNLGFARIGYISYPVELQSRTPRKLIVAFAPKGEASGARFTLVEDQGSIVIRDLELDE